MFYITPRSRRSNKHCNTPASADRVQCAVVEQASSVLQCSRFLQVKSVQ
jgi:hypothetical protein